MYQAVQINIAENIERARSSIEDTSNAIRKTSRDMVEANQTLAYLEAANSLLKNAALKVAGAREELVTGGEGDSLRATIREYYSLIDQEKIAEVLSLFSETARYVRCEAVYEGMAELENFYRNERKITGNHRINGLWMVKQVGIVEGVFVGKGAEGQPKQIGFADFFVFNDKGKIKERHTYLMLGAGYVKE